MGLNSSCPPSTSNKTSLATGPKSKQRVSNDLKVWRVGVGSSEVVTAVLVDLKLEVTVAAYGKNALFILFSVLIIIYYML